jgi:hypothetical protein
VIAGFSALKQACLTKQATFYQKKQSCLTKQLDLQKKQACFTANSLISRFSCFIWCLFGTKLLNFMLHLVPFWHKTAQFHASFGAFSCFIWCLFGTKLLNFMLHLVPFGTKLLNFMLHLVPFGTKLLNFMLHLVPFWHKVSVRVGCGREARIARRIFWTATGPSAPFAAKRCGATIRVERTQPPSTNGG